MYLEFFATAAAKLAINLISRFNVNIAKHTLPCVRRFLQNVNYHKILLEDILYETRIIINNGKNLLWLNFQQYIACLFKYIYIIF